MASVSLTRKEKADLIAKMKSFSDDQVIQLIQLFEDENQMKQQFMNSNFEANPQLLADHERRVVGNVKKYMRNTEAKSQEEDEEKEEALLKNLENL